MLKRLGREEYCSADHRTLEQERQGRLALQRLMEMSGGSRSRDTKPAAVAVAAAPEIQVTTHANFLIAAAEPLRLLARSALTAEPLPAGLGPEAPVHGGITHRQTLGLQRATQPDILRGVNSATGQQIHGHVLPRTGAPKIPWLVRSTVTGLRPAAHAALAEPEAAAPMARVSEEIRPLAWPAGSTAGPGFHFRPAVRYTVPQHGSERREWTTQTNFVSLAPVEPAGVEHSWWAPEAVSFAARRPELPGWRQSAGNLLVTTHASFLIALVEPLKTLARNALPAEPLPTGLQPEAPVHGSIAYMQTLGLQWATQPAILRGVNSATGQRIHGHILPRAGAPKIPWLVRSTVTGLRPAAHAALVEPGAAAPTARVSEEVRPLAWPAGSTAGHGFHFRPAVQDKVLQYGSERRQWTTQTNLMSLAPVEPAGADHSWCAAEAVDFAARRPELPGWHQRFEHEPLATPLRGQPAGNSLDTTHADFLIGAVEPLRLLARSALTAEPLPAGLRPKVPVHGGIAHWQTLGLQWATQPGVLRGVESATGQRIHGHVLARTGAPKIPWLTRSTVTGLQPAAHAALVEPEAAAPTARVSEEIRPLAWPAGSTAGHGFHFRPAVQDTVLQHGSERRKLTTEANFASLAPVEPASVDHSWWAAEAVNFVVRRLELPVWHQRFDHEPLAMPANDQPAGNSLDTTDPLSWTPSSLDAGASAVIPAPVQEFVALQVHSKSHARGWSNLRSCHVTPPEPDTESLFPRAPRSVLAFELRKPNGIGRVSSPPPAAWQLATHMPLGVAPVNTHVRLADDLIRLASASEASVTLPVSGLQVGAGVKSCEGLVELGLRVRRSTAPRIESNWAVPVPGLMTPSNRAWNPVAELAAVCAWPRLTLQGIDADRERGCEPVSWGPPALSVPVVSRPLGVAQMHLAGRNLPTLLALPLAPRATTGLPAAPPPAEPEPFQAAVTALSRKKVAQFPPLKAILYPLRHAMPSRQRSEDYRSRDIRASGFHPHPMLGKAGRRIGSLSGFAAPGSARGVRQRQETTPADDHRRFWNRAPGGRKWLAVGIPLVLMIWLSMPGSPSGSQGQGGNSLGLRAAVGRAASDQWLSVRQSIRRRAASELEEDFRSGLSSWQGDGEWGKSWGYDEVGMARPGQLALYTPSVGLSDYTMEFTGLVDKRALGWAFRAEDPSNYYGMRLAIARTGPAPVWELERFAVVNGKQAERKILPMPINARADTLFRIRMEIKGDRFTTIIQDQVVDTFTDSRLKRGGVGFHGVKGDRPRLVRVRITHQFDILGRLCAWLVPHPMQAVDGS